MKSRKKIILACSIVFVIVATSVVYISISAASAAKQIGQNISEKIESMEDQVIAKVGSHEITNIDVETYKNSLLFLRLFVNLVNPDAEVEDMTEGQIIQDLANNYILYSEAEKMELVVSDVVVNNYIEEQKRLFKKIDPEEAALIENFANGLGLTMDQYFDSLAPIYKRQLSIGNLRAKYVTEDMTFDEQVSIWQQERENIISQNQSMIEIIN